MRGTRPPSEDPPAAGSYVALEIAAELGGAGGPESQEPELLRVSIPSTIRVRTRGAQQAYDEMHAWGLLF